MIIDKMTLGYLIQELDAAKNIVRELNDVVCKLENDVEIKNFKMTKSKEILKDCGAVEDKMKELLEFIEK